MYKKFSRKLLSEYFNEEYSESESARVVALPDGYQIN